MNRKVFLGCGGIAAFLAAAVVAAIVLLVPRAVNRAKGWFGQVVADNLRVAALEKSWRPPSASPDGAWFPASVDGWTCGKVAVVPGLPELNIEREASSATYTKGDQQMTVAVLAANDLEREALFARAKSALENEANTSGTLSGPNYRVNYNTSGGRMTMSSGNRLYVRTNGVNHSRLWWLNGWLFVFRTKGGPDPESFMQQYLDAMQPTALEAPR